MSSARKKWSTRIPPFFRRLFKFTSMDFETAVWEMTHLIIAPKKVFRNIYYHKQTRDTYQRADPAFTYLLSFFLFLSGIAWGVAYAEHFSSTLWVAFVFVAIHFLLLSLVVSTAMFFLVGRVLGRRHQGLFGPPSGGGESLEFGYCFDVSIRAFIPIWTFLYVLQFLLMPLIAPDYWVSNLFGNTMYLLALSYYFVITFLGYNALPFLTRTEVLLSPIPVLIVVWIISLFALDCTSHLAPILWTGIGIKPGGV